MYFQKNNNLIYQKKFQKIDRQSYYENDLQVTERNLNLLYHFEETNQILNKKNLIHLL